MTFEVLKFTPENLKRHIKADRHEKDLGGKRKVIFTTRNRWLDSDDRFIIPGLGKFIVTDHWTYENPSSLNIFIDFYKQEGFETPDEFYREITKIYADENGKLPPLHVHRLVEDRGSAGTSLGVAFEEILPLLKAGCKATRIKWQDTSQLKPLVVLGTGNNFYSVPASVKHSVSLYHPSSEDLLADDWILCKGGEE